MSFPGNSRVYGWFRSDFLKKTLVFLGFFIPIVLFFVSVSVFAPDAPWWDEYFSTIGYLAHPAPERFWHLFDFHNEHRLIFPRLVFELLDLVPGRLSFFLCIIVGDCILLGYLALWAWAYRVRDYLLCFIPFVWIFLDLANCENTLWGLAAVQNHSVLLFALAASFAFAFRRSLAWFVTSLVLAVLATASSATGLGIWPALFISAILSGSGWRERLRDGAVVGVTGLIVIGLYLQGFLAATSSHTAQYPWTVLKACDFLLCFLGNLAPVAVVARILGFCSLVATIYILWHVRRLAKEPVFTFFLYLHSITASGVLVRSCMPGAGLFSRLGIIPISIFCCEAYLILKLWEGTPLFAKARKWLVRGIPVAIVANLLALAVGSTFLGERKAEIESGYRAWPQDRTRLPTPCPEIADRNLQRYVDRIEGICP